MTVVAKHRKSDLSGWSTGRRQALEEQRLKREAAERAKREAAELEQATRKAQQAVDRARGDR